MCEEENNSKLKVWGVAGTKIYLVLLFGGVPVAAHFGLVTFTSMKLNEIGDLLAGAFGPLAILWLVLGYFQQGEELRNSVKTLKLQAEELARSVEQQQELVTVTREQLDHERSVLKNQELIRKKRIQPKLIVEFGPEILWGDGTARYSLNVKNTGNPASKFATHLWDGTNVVASESLKYLDRGGSVNTYAFQGKAILPPINELKIEINYADEDGDRWELTYLVEPPHDLNKHELSTIVEVHSKIIGQD